MKDKGGVKELIINEEKIDGENATVTYTLTYGNGEDRAGDHPLHPGGWEVEDDHFEITTGKAEPARTVVSLGQVSAYVGYLLSRVSGITCAWKGHCQPIPLRRICMISGSLHPFWKSMPRIRILPR